MGGKVGAPGAYAVEHHVVDAGRPTHGVGLLALAGHDRDRAVSIADLGEKHEFQTLFLL